MQNFIRWAGVVGSLLLGGSIILKGDTATGIGIITSSLGSASILPVK